MKKFIEETNAFVTEDTILFTGQKVEAGARITIVSSQGTYNGMNMRIPPPDFEALMLFSAIESARKAEELKKDIIISQSDFDGMDQIETNNINHSNFFTMCQHVMTAVAFSISAIESWANKSFITHGVKSGEPIKLTMKRPNKPDKIIFSNKISSDSNIPIRPKLFQLIPQVFNANPLKEHSTLKQSVISLVEERNVVMHMQSIVVIDNDEFERISYAIKLLKVSSFNAPETVLKYITYIYDKSKINEPAWVSLAKKELQISKRKVK